MKKLLIAGMVIATISLAPISSVYAESNTAATTPDSNAKIDKQLIDWKEKREAIQQKRAVMKDKMKELKAKKKALHEEMKTKKKALHDEFEQKKKALKEEMKMKQDEIKASVKALRQEAQANKKQ